MGLRDLFWDVFVGRVRPCCGERPPTCRCDGWIQVIDTGFQSTFQSTLKEYLDELGPPPMNELIDRCGKHWVRIGHDRWYCASAYDSPPVHVTAYTTRAALFRPDGPYAPMTVVN